MDGRVSDVAARIQQQCPLALNVHCFSPNLKFVIVNAWQVQAVRNAMDVISKIASFFENSSKRQVALKEKIQETEQPNRKKHLLDLCRTRSIYRHKALENFSQFYETLVDLLQDIKSSREGWNRNTVTDSAELLNAIVQFQFLMAFAVMWKALTILKGLSISLHSSSIDNARHTEKFRTPKQVCIVFGTKSRTSTLSGLIWLKACRKQFLLEVQKFHGGVDDRGTGITFQMKIQKSTTRDQLLSSF